jgi:hypothetical protein
MKRKKYRSLDDPWNVWEKESYIFKTGCKEIDNELKGVPHLVLFYGTASDILLNNILKHNNINDFPTMVTGNIFSVYFLAELADHKLNKQKLAYETLAHYRNIAYEANTTCIVVMKRPYQENFDFSFRKIAEAILVINENEVNLIKNRYGKTITGIKLK